MVINFKFGSIHQWLVALLVLLMLRTTIVTTSRYQTLMLQWWSSRTCLMALWAKTYFPWVNCVESCSFNLLIIINSTWVRRTACRSLSHEDLRLAIVCVKLKLLLLIPVKNYGPQLVLQFNNFLVYLVAFLLCDPTFLLPVTLLLLAFPDFFSMLLNLRL